MESPDCGILKPSSREGAIFMRYGRYGIFYGGFTSNLKMRDAWKLDTVDWKWELLKCKGRVPDVGRYGHSANMKNDSLIIFGG